MSELIRKQHNVSILLYHIVCPAKYRKAIFTADVDEKLREVCADIALRYEIEFLEIGTDSDHVHFFVQSVPLYSPEKDRTNYQINYGTRDIQADAGSEKAVMGRTVLVGRLLRLNGRRTRLEEVIKQYVKNQGSSKENIQPRLF